MSKRIVADYDKDDIFVVHPRFKNTRTHTRRLATSDPNVLAFPKHDKPGGKDYGSMVRNCFVCPPGEIFLEADLSQIESRLLAHESGDELLCAMFNEGRDIHGETAAYFFGLDYSKLDKDYWKDGKGKVQRFFAKRINFGIPYGVSGMGLATQLRLMPDINYDEWNDRVCERHIQSWHKLYKGASKYIADVEAEVSRAKDKPGVEYKYAPQPGVIEDCWGMIRYLPGVWANDRKIASEAKRQAVNHRIQGGSQGLLQCALAWLYPRIKDMQAQGENVHLCLSVHDSLILRLNERLYDTVSALVLEALTKHGGLVMRVPTAADVKQARSWGQL
jgi:DNA polymerase I